MSVPGQRKPLTSVHVSSQLQARGQIPYQQRGPAPHTVHQYTRQPDLYDSQRQTPQQTQQHTIQAQAAPQLRPLVPPQSIQQQQAQQQQTTGPAPRPFLNSAQFPHDINGQPGVPSTHVPHPVASHTPPQSVGNLSVMYQSTTPQGPRPSFQQRSQNIIGQPRPQRQQNPSPVNISSSPNMYMSSQNQQNPPATMFLQGQPTPPYMTGQTQIITIPGYQQGQRMPTYIQPGYPMQAPQNYYNPAAAAAASQMPHSNPTVYYSGTNAQNNIMQQQQRPPATTGSAAYTKRERKGIPIIDPNTMKDIREDISTDKEQPAQGTPPQAVTPVSQQQQQQQQSNEIGSIFAKQVSQRMKEDMGSEPQHQGTPSPPVHHPQVPPPQGLTSQPPPRIPPPNIQQPPPNVASQQVQAVPVHLKQPPPPQQPQVPGQAQVHMVAAPHSVAVPPPAHQRPNIPPQVVPSVIQIQQPPPPTSSDKGQQASPAKVAEEQKLAATVVPVEQSPMPPREKSEPKEPQQTQEPVKELTPPPPVETKRPDIVVTPPPTEKVTEPEVKPEAVQPSDKPMQQETNVVNEPVKPAEPQKTEEVTVPEKIGEPAEVENQKKRKGKQKLKDLNQKGEAKEGSDMDAFADTKASPPETDGPSSAGAATVQAETNNVDAAVPAPTPAAATAQPTPPAEVAPPSQKEPSPQPPTTKQVPNNVQVTIEDKQVHELNEKNKTSEANKENREQNNVNSNSTEESVIKKKTELNYQYKEDQWSPLNPEGKKMYDRNFLLNLQKAPESLKRPMNLPDLPGVSLDRPNEVGQRLSNKMGREADFTPSYFKDSSSRGGPPKRNSQQKQRNDQPRKIISLPQQEVKLHKTDNAWAPSLKVKEELTPEEKVTAETYKKVRSILNKLTPQKFQKLVQQIRDLSIDTEDRLTGSIDIIFEKAIDEPNFSVAYANLCRHMFERSVPKQSNPNEMVTFKSLLLTRCQREFEKDRAEALDSEMRQKAIDEAKSEEDKKRLKEEKDEAEMKNKRRSLGNIRFIGELFKLKLLTENIMHKCLSQLLTNGEEESLECLCRLLNTIGKDIDVPKSKYKDKMESYFTQLRAIVDAKKVSSRVRFMIRDVIDLRRDNWVPRREDNNPKTIQQIHQEAQQEEVERQILIQKVTQEQKARGGGRGGHHRGSHSNQPQQADDGWTAVRPAKIDPNKMKITKQTLDDNIKLGPGGRPGSFGSWGRGSMGGANKTDEAERPPPSPANRFSALSGQGPERQERTADASYDSRRGGRDGPTRGMSREKNRFNTPRGKGMRSSQEHDREAAIAAARSISGSRNTSGSRNQSRESSRNRDVPRESKKPEPAQQPKELSEEVIEKKTKSLMDEYLHIHDLKEAIECVRELESPQSIHMFVYFAINHVLERSKQARQMTGELLHDLVKFELITVSQYLKGLNEILQYAEDMEIDIPKIWEYLGELISPMVQDGSIPIVFLKEVCSPFVRINKAGILVGDILNDAVHRLGHLKVAEQWKESGLSWEMFFPPEKQSEQYINEFLSKHKLEFTLEANMEPRSPVQPKPDQIQKELDRLIVVEQRQNEDIFDWVEINLGDSYKQNTDFIRALMTSVCKSAIDGEGPTSTLNTDKLKNRVVLLARYLEHESRSELHALYALQALVHELEHPQGLLRGFFDALYDEDVISEDAFEQWESSTDTAEQTGKGVAKASVVQFFTWLREAEEEDS